MVETREQIKAEALREAASDFQRAARVGIEPVLNREAARLLYLRAERIERGESTSNMVERFIALESSDSGPWRDRQGDVWHLGDDGLLHSHETAPFTREHVERKWGPLVPVSSDSGSDR